jgi:hypothetical protein
MAAGLVGPVLRNGCRMYIHIYFANAPSITIPSWSQRSKLMVNCMNAADGSHLLPWRFSVWYFIPYFDNDNLRCLPFRHFLLLFFLSAYYVRRHVCPKKQAIAKNGCQTWRILGFIRSSLVSPQKAETQTLAPDERGHCQIKTRLPLIWPVDGHLVVHSQKSFRDRDCR